VSSSLGRRITLISKVKNRGRIGRVPTGDVVFSDGTTVLGTIPLRHGKASLKVSNLPIGPNPIEVQYDGAQYYTPSDSPVRVVDIRS
jgi:hypothetical protein